MGLRLFGRYRRNGLLFCLIAATFLPLKLQFIDIYWSPPRIPVRRQIGGHSSYFILVTRNISIVLSTDHRSENSIDKLYSKQIGFCNSMQKEITVIRGWSRYIPYRKMKRLLILLLISWYLKKVLFVKPQTRTVLTKILYVVRSNSKFRTWTNEQTLSVNIYRKCTLNILF